MYNLLMFFILGCYKCSGHKSFCWHVFNSLIYVISLLCYFSEEWNCWVIGEVWFFKLKCKIHSANCVDPKCTAWIIYAKWTQGGRCHHPGQGSCPFWDLKLEQSEARRERILEPLISIVAADETLAATRVSVFFHVRIFSLPIDSKLPGTPPVNSFLLLSARPGFCCLQLRNPGGYSVPHHWHHNFSGVCSSYCCNSGQKLPLTNPRVFTWPRLNTWIPGPTGWILTQVVTLHLT